MKADCHVHMILDGVWWKDAIARHREKPDEAYIRRVLQRYHDLGYTHLRDGGDAWGVCTLAAKLASEYDIVYRTPAFPIHKNGHYGSFIGCGFDSAADYQSLLYKAKEQGADFIKIMISGLIDFDRPNVLTSEPLSGDEIADMIERAHDMGFCVMAHANGAETVKAAIAGGVDSIEHGAYLDDEAILMLAESHAVWVPTISTIGNLFGRNRHSDDCLKKIFDMHAKNIAKAAKLGARIAVGSDAGAYAVFHGSGGVDEERYLSEIIGSNADNILHQGNREIFDRF